MSILFQLTHFCYKFRLPFMAEQGKKAAHASAARDRK